MDVSSLTKPLVGKIDASSEIKALDAEIRSRFAKRTGALSSFLQQWILLEESQTQFFNARGLRGENYLHYLLSIGELNLAHGVVTMCNEFARSTVADGVVSFLKHIDLNGNDVWHYLAENLANHEDDYALQIAQTLIQLDIDFCRKNDQDQSPLAHLLIPEVKWASINAMVKVRRLALDEIEDSFSDTISQNEAVMAAIIVNILVSDLMNNNGQLLNQMLDFAISPRSEKTDRAPLLRGIFNYVGGNRNETVFMRLIETDLRELFGKVIKLIELGAEDATRQKAASDAPSARQEKQVYFYRHFSKVNKVGTGLLHRMVLANRPSYILPIMNLLSNEPLWQINPKRGEKGQPERINLIVDRASAAPCNPNMSLLLQQDQRGNTAFHLALMTGQDECLRKFFVGISTTDTAAIISRIPNRYNLTLLDLTQVQRSYAKLTVEIKAGRLSIEEAQNILALVKKLNIRIIEYLLEFVKNAEESIKRSNGKLPIPSFDAAKFQHHHESIAKPTADGSSSTVTPSH